MYDRMMEMMTDHLQTDLAIGLELLVTHNSILYIYDSVQTVEP
jgi:hypothetical protein